MDGWQNRCTSGEGFQTPFRMFYINWKDLMFKVRYIVIYIELFVFFIFFALVIYVVYYLFKPTEY